MRNLKRYSIDLNRYECCYGVIRIPIKDDWRNISSVFNNNNILVFVFHPSKYYKNNIKFTWQNKKKPSYLSKRCLVTKVKYSIYTISAFENLFFVKFPKGDTAKRCNICKSIVKNKNYQVMGYNNKNTTHVTKYNNENLYSKNSFNV